MDQANYYVLLTDVTEITANFTLWHDALRGSPEKPDSPKSWWLDDQGIGVRLVRASDRSEFNALGSTLRVPGADLRADRCSREVAVQINPGNRPGNGNVPSAVARGPDGGLWLLRQAWLKARPGSADVGKAISERTADFVSRTGLTPVAVKVAAPPHNRLWCIVCPLSQGAEATRDATGAFVRLAAHARLSADISAEADHPDLKTALELSASLPRGGPFDYAPRQGGVGQRLEDDVVNALADLVSPPGTPRRWRRPMHAAGYTVDLEVFGGSEPLLIEAKSGRSAAHVQQGVGQLVLYPLLIKRLQKHRKVLLLPRPANSALEDVLPHADVLRVGYGWTGDKPGEGKVEFDPVLIALCGI